MLTLIPAGRAIIDRRREARGTLKTATPDIEGIARHRAGGGAGWEGEVTRRPAPYIIVVVAVTIGLGYAGDRASSRSSASATCCPGAGVCWKDLNTLDTAVGGSTEITSVLLKAEATDTRTLLNLEDLSERLPGRVTAGRRAASGPIHHLLRDSRRGLDPRTAG